MSTPAEITVQQAIEQIRELMATGDNVGALTFGQEIVPALRGQLTGRDYWIISQLLSSADRAAYDVEPGEDQIPLHQPLPTPD